MFRLRRVWAHLEEDGCCADLLVVGLVAVAEVASVWQVQGHDAVVGGQQSGVHLCQHMCVTPTSKHVCDTDHYQIPVLSGCHVTVNAIVGLQHRAVRTSVTHACGCDRSKQTTRENRRDLNQCQVGAANLDAVDGLQQSLYTCAKRMSVVTKKNAVI